MTQDFGEGAAAEFAETIIAAADALRSAETAKHVARTMLENARQGFWNVSKLPWPYRIRTQPSVSHCNDEGLTSVSALRLRDVSVQARNANAVTGVSELMLYPGAVLKGLGPGKDAWLGL